MIFPARSLVESCLLHGVLAGLLLASGHLITPQPPAIRLDFSLENLQPPPQAQNEPVATVPSPQPVPPAHARPPAPKPRPVAPKPAATNKSIPAPVPAQTAVAEAAPAPESQEDAPAQSTLAATGAGSASPGAAEGSEAYRRANFALIRDAILAHLRYPPLARRLGLSGKVEVCFVITPEGSVRELRVRNGSGHEILDEQALAAVRSAAPFPPPRMTAFLVMPIAFQLND